MIAHTNTHTSSYVLIQQAIIKELTDKNIFREITRQGFFTGNGDIKDLTFNCDIICVISSFSDLLGKKRAGGLLRITCRDEWAIFVCYIFHATPPSLEVRPGRLLLYYSPSNARCPHCRFFKQCNDTVFNLSLSLSSFRTSCVASLQSPNWVRFSAINFISRDWTRPRFTLFLQQHHPGYSLRHEIIH